MGDLIATLTAHWTQIDPCYTLTLVTVFLNVILKVKNKI